MSLGRNDPCHCGSGKKYKKCCLIENQPDQGEFLRRKWAAVQEGLIRKLIEHINQFYWGQDAFDEAYDEFQMSESETPLEFDRESPEISVFMPWFFNQWQPDPECSILEDAPQMPPAQSLLESGRNLTENEKLYLKACLETAFSFFEVLEVEPGQSLTLRDVLAEKNHHILERKGTQSVQKGDLLFGQIIEIEGIAIFAACAPILIPPQFKIQVIALRRELLGKRKSLTIKRLRDCYLEVLALYREIYENFTNPQSRILTNTDGHLLIPHKLIFEIDDAMATFEALHHLDFNDSREGLLEMAKIDKEDKLLLVEFPWLKKGNKQNKQWDNTVLGHIKIEPKQMTVEVNSKERAAKFKSTLKKLIPAGIKLKTTLVESIESNLDPSKIATRMQSSPQLQSTSGSPLGIYANPEDLEREHEELMQNPEIRAHMEKMMKSHWDKWIKSPLPALGGLKPSEAATFKDGREALDALLTQFERNAKEYPMVGQTVETFKAIRRKLRL